MQSIEAIDPFGKTRVLDAAPRVGDRFFVILKPIGGLLTLSETATRRTIELWGAVNYHYSVEGVFFPTINGVKMVGIIIKQENLPVQIPYIGGTVGGVTDRQKTIISLAALFGAGALLVHEVKPLLDKGPAIAISAGLAAGAASVFPILALAGAGFVYWRFFR